MHRCFKLDIKTVKIVKHYTMKQTNSKTKIIEKSQTKDILKNLKVKIKMMSRKSVDSTPPPADRTVLQLAHHFLEVHLKMNDSETKQFLNFEFS